MTEPGLLAELSWRGMIHESTSGLAARLASRRPIVGYNGFDPSAPSLHVGHLVPIFGLLHFQRHGGRPVALLGGATGMIGDPSGRSAERVLLDRGTIDAHSVSIRSQLERFLDFDAGTGGAILANNLDWLGEVRMLDFLRDVGKHFTIPYMLAKDSVQVRLDRGLSFTEFSYMLLQAADFLHLHRALGVELQMGGADQWGNITAGLELIRRAAGPAAAGAADEPVHGLAYPLLLNASGAKFGKSESGESIWLDAARTSPYAFHQYWLNADDRDVGTYLRWFTLFAREEVEALDAESTERPEHRLAQRRLALDITTRVHGAADAERAERLGDALFGGDVRSLGIPELELATRALPAAVVRAEHAATVLGLALAVGAAGSRGEARRLLSQGGLYVNDTRVTEAEAAPPPALHGRFWVIRTGKRTQRIAELAAAP